MKFVLFAALLLLSRGVMAGEPDQALIDAARKEGSVVWYSTLIINQIVRPMVDAFEAKYPGIKVEYSRAASSDVALKIVNEARARRVQSDIFDGSNTVFLLRDPAAGDAAHAEGHRVVAGGTQEQRWHLDRAEHFPIQPRRSNTRSGQA